MFNIVGRGKGMACSATARTKNELARVKKELARLGCTDIRITEVQQQKRSSTIYLDRLEAIL